MPLPSDILKRKFSFEPTADQLLFFRLLDGFIDGTETKKVVLLTGYAGTGKTTLLSALVNVLPLFNYKYMLLAPTGRAAKVINSYTKRTAYTLHKIMFKPEIDDVSGALIFKRQKNYSKHTVFIIDEASMISSNAEYGRKSLIEQIIEFVFEQPTNRLLIVGDDAQLPPVGDNFSKSLDVNYLKSIAKIDIRAVVLREVIRQKQDSGILYNATFLRNLLALEKPEILFKIKPYNDIYKMTSERLEDGLKYAYEKFGWEQTMIICRTNKSAVMYNRYIRHQIFYYENELEVGDILMITRNNYHYLDEESSIGFLANGDFAVVSRLMKTEEVHGMRFALVELTLLDYPEEPFEARLILDTLHMEGPSMSPEAYQHLYKSVELDYEDIADQKERQKLIKNDPYLNALQVKFAYALTCHKSQGGQWGCVFVDQGYLTDEMINHDYVRWLYTAMTRATDQLFLLNFHGKFFSD